MKNKLFKPKPNPVLYSFSPSKKLPIDEYEILRSLAKDMPPDVLIRLEWIIFYETIAVKDATYTSDYFNISRKTFHKWYTRFKERKRRIESLLNESRAPHNTRKWEVTPI